MTNRKTTRRALVLSLLSLLLCCSMLVGTTFAWFTDSVTSGKNQIVAGNLDIELEYSKTMADGSWKDVEGQTDLVDPNALWEPGHTEVVYLRLTNAGTLVLKYNFGISVANSVIGKSVLGNDIELAKYLKYALIENVTEKFANRDAARAEAEEAPKDLASYSDKGVMEPGDTRTVALVIYMPEEVGNEANYRGTDIPSIELGVTVVATQKDAEVDSFGPDYDEGAWVETMSVSTEAELITALNAATTKNVRIVLDKDIALTDPWTPIGDKDKGVYFVGTLDGNGHTISGLNVAANDYDALISAAKDATIKNLTVEGTVNGVNAAGIVARIEGETVVENCVSNVAVTGTTKAGGIACNVTGADAKIINCVNKGNINGGNNGIGGIVGYVNNDANLEILNCTNNGNVTSDTNKYAGAAVGYAAGTSTGLVVDMTNTGVITGTLLSDGRYLVEDGTVLCGYVGKIGNWVSAEGISTAEELQAALDAATGDTAVRLTSNIVGDVTVTAKPDVKITIDGNGKTFAGVITVDGKSATYANAALTIKDLTFKADSISADACIRLGDGTNATRYTTNVTVDGCTFDVPGAVGIKSYTGGDKNLTVKNCTATANAHSLIQAKGIDGILVEGCEVYSKNGLNFNNSDNVVVDGCTVDVKGYAVRFGESSGGTGAAETYLIKNSTLKSANDEGDATIILRGTADYATLTIENTTIVGDPDIKNTATGATVK